MPPAPRLLAHALAVGWCLFQLSPDMRALPWIPLPLERLVEALAWLWFINLFNFMDGIDGLAGSEAMALALGYLGVAGLAGLDRHLCAALRADRGSHDRRFSCGIGILPAYSWAIPGPSRSGS